MMENNHGKILLLSGVRGDTRRYRTLHPYEQLRMLGMQVALAHLMDTDVQRKVDRADVVIFHRAPMDDLVDRLFSSVERRGGVGILDVDDLIFDEQAFEWIDSPDFTDPVRERLYRQEMRRQQQTLERCHAVIASTNFLAERVQSFGKTAYIHRNAFSLEMAAISAMSYAEKPSHGERIVLGYASGTRTHDKDFALVRAAIQEILNRYPQTELWCIGPLAVGNAWGGAEKRVHRIPLVPWRQLPILLSQFDINLAPLVCDNPFARSKSEIKYMEAALVHVPTVASPTEAFQYAIRDGENGYLAEDELQWMQKLEMLVQDRELRKKTGEAAYGHVWAEYHPTVRAYHLAEIIHSIVQNAGLPEIPMPEIQPSMNPDPHLYEHLWTGWDEEEHPSMLAMAWYFLRWRGVRYFFGQAWVWMRRLLSPIFPFRARRAA